jgi:hypothetical protein
MMQLLEHLSVVRCGENFPSGQEMNQYATLGFTEKCSQVFLA